MAELNIEYHPCCTSVVRIFSKVVKGSRGTNYTVYKERDSYHWHCECPDHKIRKRECKHIRKVKPDFCGWQQIYHGDQPVDGKCPRCGDEVTASGYGV